MNAKNKGKEKEDKMMIYLDTAGIWIFLVIFLVLELGIFRTKLGVDSCMAHMNRLEGGAGAVCWHE
jgi:hypothetical protein